MQQKIAITAEVRARGEKNKAGPWRAGGSIPAVVYGAYKDSVSIGVSPKELVHILNSKTGHNTIFNLAIQGGENPPDMVVESQRAPLKGNLLLGDLKRIDLPKRIRVSVPATPSGAAQGLHRHV